MSGNRPQECRKAAGFPAAFGVPALSVDYGEGSKGLGRVVLWQIGVIVAMAAPPKIE